MSTLVRFSVAYTLFCAVMGACNASGDADRAIPKAPAAEPLTSGTGEPQKSPGGIRVGAKLYSPDGELWGTVVGIEDPHTFPNGVTEAGVLVDYGARMGNPPVPPQWLPRRSAERFTVK
jgi:hypothetical protein